MSRSGFAAAMVLQAASVTLVVGAGLLTSGGTTFTASNPGVRTHHDRPATAAESTQHRAEMAADEFAAQEAALRKFMDEYPAVAQ